MSAITRWDRWGLPICLVIALSLRGLVLLIHGDELSRDRDAYLAMARCVAEGKGYVDPDRLTPSAFRPPFYPLQLAGLMLLTPASAAVAVVNLVWGGIGVWATWRAGQWLGLGAGAWLAALLVAMDPMLLQYSAQPMTEVTCAGLVALLVYWIVRGDLSERVRQFGTGLIFGGLVLCRPTFWPLAGLATFILVVEAIRSSGSSNSRPPCIPWSLLVGIVLVVAPWILRNQLVIGTPIVMTTHGGYTLLLANNPVFYSDVVERGWGAEWKSESFDRWQAELQAELASDLGPDASELARDRWQSQRARAFMSSNPGRFMRAAWYRVRSLWSTRPQGEAANSRLVMAVSGFYTVELLGFLVGMIVVMRRSLVGPNDDRARRRAWMLLAAIVATVQLVHLVYWTNARMRAPLLPVIGLFAAAALPARAATRRSAG